MVLNFVIKTKDNPPQITYLSIIPDLVRVCCDILTSTSIDMTSDSYSVYIVANWQYSRFALIKYLPLSKEIAVTTDVFTDEQIFETTSKVSDINLSYVENEVARQYGSNSRALQAVNNYRRFLVLCCLYPEEEISPTTDVDAVWHIHICDTEAYAKDCETIFGKFLHHKPHKEICSLLSVATRERCLARTRELYILVWDEDPSDNNSEIDPLQRNSGGCSSCGAG